jgi:uncharacterized protein
MSSTLSATVIPAVENMFQALDNILVKAAERCETTKVEEKTYLDWRVAADMFPLATQIRFATEIPARSLSRLAGAELPSFPDDEKSFAELRARIDRARKIIKGLDAAALDANPDANITVPMGPDRKVTLPRAAFAHQWVLPNLYFHVTAAYLILRGLGVDIGKRDYLIAMGRYFGE